MALADANGEVHASIPGLARAANVTLRKAEDALATFLAPDSYSRTKDNEGRRLEVIEGGWRLLNYDHYRRIMSADERREYKTRKQREYRERKQGGNVDNGGQMKSVGGRKKADTDTDTEVILPSGSITADAPAQDANIPTLEEVKAFGRKAVPEAIPDDCCERFWHWHTNSNGWVKNNALIKWQNVLRQWWNRDKTDPKHRKSGEADYSAWGATK